MAVLLATGCSKKPEDEAKLAGLTPADFPQITADIFKPMDGGIALTQDEIMGRNAWNLWSGGNQHFWNRVAQDSYGLLDVLKTLDNRKYKREERFKTLGLVNQPLPLHLAARPAQGAPAARALGRQQRHHGRAQQERVFRHRHVPSDYRPARDWSS